MVVAAWLLDGCEKGIHTFHIMMCEVNWGFVCMSTTPRAPARYPFSTVPWMGSQGAMMRLRADGSYKQFHSMLRSPSSIQRLGTLFGRIVLIYKISVIGGDCLHLRCLSRL